MAARRAVNQALASKCVHIRMQPRPANLSESREIFRVLQKFGEISTYTHLRHEYANPAPNIAVAIYRDSESARQAIDASPIRFALETVDPNEAEPEFDEQAEDSAYLDGEPAPNTHGLSDDGVEEITRPSQLLNRPSHPQPLSHTPPPQEPTPDLRPFPGQEYPNPKSSVPTQKKWFHVTVDRSRVVHQDYVERQPFWKRFIPMKTMMQEDLAKSVPLVGLSDMGKRPENQHRTPAWVLKEEGDRLARKRTLRQVLEETEAERMGS